MRILADFMNGFAFVRMAPKDEVVSIGGAPDLSARALVEEGRQYAIYVGLVDAGRKGSVDPLRDLATKPPPARTVDLAVTLPAGRYEATWVNPATGEIAAPGRVDHKDGARTFTTPAFTTDVALKIVRVGA
jgi:hypothetical protein